MCVCVCVCARACVCVCVYIYENVEVLGLLSKRVESPFKFLRGINTTRCDEPEDPVRSSNKEKDIPKVRGEWAEWAFPFTLNFWVILSSHMVSVTWSSGVDPSVYAPTLGSNEEVILTFYRNLRSVIGSISEADKIILLGDSEPIACSQSNIVEMAFFCKEMAMDLYIYIHIYIYIYIYNKPNSPSVPISCRNWKVF